MHSWKTPLPAPLRDSNSSESDPLVRVTVTASWRFLLVLFMSHLGFLKLIYFLHETARDGEIERQETQRVPRHDMLV